MELFFKISSNIFVILFLITSLIILMIVLDKLRTRLVGCRKISLFFGLCACFSFVGFEQQSANKIYLPGKLMYVNRIGETSSEKWNQKVLIRHGCDVCQSLESSIMDFFR